MADEIEARLAMGVRPTCHVGHGRLHIVVRGIGATRWSPEAQLARALEMAAVAREVLTGDERASVRGNAKHAVVVRFEDVEARRGCDVRAQWECVVPTPSEPTTR